MSQDAPLTLTFHIRSDDGLLEADFQRDLLKAIIQTPKILITPHQPANLTPAFQLQNLKAFRTYHQTDIRSRYPIHLLLGP